MKKRFVLNLIVILALVTLAMPVHSASARSFLAAPTNDDISAATNIGSINLASNDYTTVQSGTDIQGATRDTTVQAGSPADPTPSCAAAAVQHTVWYKVTPTEVGNLVVNTLYSTYDTVVAVYTYNNVSNTLTEVGCNDTSISGGTVSYLQTPITPGTTYYVEVASKDVTSYGTLEIRVFLEVKNDDFNMPIVIPSLSTIYVNTQSDIQYATSDAKDDTGSPKDPTLSCSWNGNSYYTVWYKVTPADDGALIIDTVGSDYDTLIAVWTYDSASNTLFKQGCNDDAPTEGGVTLRSYLEVAATAGTDYYIEVASIDPASYGTLALKVGLRIGANPDLVIGPVTVTDPTPGDGYMAGDIIKFEMDVTNASETAAGGFYIGMFDDDTGTLLGEFPVISLNGNGVVHATFYYQFSVGNKNIYFKADHNQIIVEGSEANNKSDIFSFYVDGDFPDFTITSYQIIKANPLESIVEVTVKNLGDFTNAFWVDAFIDQTYDSCTFLSDESTQVLSLDHNEVKTVQINLGALSLGDHYVFVVADAACETGDPNPLNNSTPEIDFTVTSGPVNDEIGGAKTVTVTDTTAYLDSSADVSTASSNVSDPTNPTVVACGFSAGQETVWYKFIPTTSRNVKFTTATSNYDTTLAVWKGTPGSLTLVGCNNDVSAPTNKTSSYSLKAKADQTYYIEIATVTKTPATRLLTLKAEVIQTFADVSKATFSWDFIEKVYANGITGGCTITPVMNYCPSDPVNRAQMAIFLLRAKYGDSYKPDPATGMFTDVNPSDFFAPWIEALAREGITGGCSTTPMKYCPSNVVTRTQMAIFLLRAKHGSAYVPPVATGIFADVPADTFAAPFIEKLAADGVTGGCATSPQLLYCPYNEVSRAQMAIFLVRTFNMK